MTARQARPHPELPHPELHRLDRRAGTWQMSGGRAGPVHHARAEAGSFLMRHGDRPNTGLEVIGPLHPFGGERSADLPTRVYSFTDGLTLEDVYDPDGDTLTIRSGHAATITRVGAS